MACCTKHPFDQAAAQCRDCGGGFCEECLVYVNGPNKPPRCIHCTMVAAGLRRRSKGVTRTLLA